MGGYVSLPGGLMSIFYNIPLLIHEQNRILGLSNRILSKLSTKVMQAFPETMLNAKTVGNPLRKEITDLKNPISRLKNRTGPIRTLVLGGSQGSKMLNSIFPEVSYILKEKIITWHQSGKNNKSETLNNYKKFKIYPYKITSFVKNIEKAYTWADIIICRSGAITVSEIEHIKIPAIFIPFPHKDKHQYWNAYPLKLKGGAIIIEQKFLSTHIIVKILKKINRKRIISMSKRLHSKIHTNSINNIIDIIEKTV